MPMSKSTYYFELNKVDLVDKRNTELKDEIQLKLQYEIEHSVNP